MTTAPIIRKPMPRKPPAKRLFTGMVGLPPEEPPTPASPAPVVPVAPAMPKKLGRPPKNGVAMTATERKTQSRADLKQKQHDAERRQLISALMKIYRRQQSEIMFDPKRQRKMDELRKVDRQQRRTYLAELEGLPIEKLRLAMEGKNTKTGESGAMEITTDAWYAPVPGYGEAKEFNKRMAVKLGNTFGSGMQQIAQMLLVTALILGAGQVHHLGSHWFTDPMSGLATSVAMGENGGPLLFIGRQDASHVSG